jgi:hypothetical protein
LLLLVAFAFEPACPQRRAGFFPPGAPQYRHCDGFVALTSMVRALQRSEPGLERDDFVFALLPYCLGMISACLSVIFAQTPSALVGQGKSKGNPRKIQGKSKRNPSENRHPPIGSRPEGVLFRIML